MELSKTDIRIIKTRKKLKVALLTILKDKEFYDISVRELTAVAGIGFKTFYRHYPSVRDFAAKFILDELSRDDRPIGKNISREALIENGISLFKVVDDKSRLFGLLKYGEITQEVVPVLRKWTEISSKDILENFSSESRLKSLVTNHLVYSVIGLITWRTENLDTYSQVEMGEIYYNLIISSTQHFLVRY